jgi:hypothetical protein
MTRSAIASAFNWAAGLRRLAAVAALGAPMLVTGCQQKALCPELATCGGDIKGDWKLANDHFGTCQEEVYAAPADPRLGQANGDLPPARQPAPEPALYDWCDLLVTGFGSIVHTPPLFFAQGPSGYQAGPANVANYYVTGPIGAANLHYGDGTYTLTTIRSGTYYLDFPSVCVRNFGARDGNAIDPSMVDPATNQPTGATGNVCQQLEFGLNKIGGANYSNIKCGLDPNDPPATAGCICQFDLHAVEVNSGFYGTSPDGTVQHLPGNNFPQFATYCADANNLQLTGLDGAYLFDRVGLRTLDMVRDTMPPPTPDAGM